MDFFTEIEGVQSLELGNVSMGNCFFLASLKKLLGISFVDINPNFYAGVLNCCRVRIALHYKCLFPVHFPCNASLY
jgi:hypothetical protein